MKWKRTENSNSIDYEAEGESFVATITKAKGKGSTNYGYFVYVWKKSGKGSLRDVLSSEVPSLKEAKAVVFRTVVKL